MNWKTPLGILLFAHVLVHPVVHGLPGAVAPPTHVESGTDESGVPVDWLALGPCLGCRTGSSLVALSTAFLAHPGLPGWESVASLARDGTRSSLSSLLSVRAPPLA